jgi:nucleotide-binding universal stress UspA family protein
MPLAAEANLELLGQLGRALVRPGEASLTLAHILPEGADTTGHHAASAFLRNAAERCGFLGEVSFRVTSSNDVAEGILAMAWEFDAIVLGLTRNRSLTERILGSISDQVATWARCTTYLVRAAE